MLYNAVAAVIMRAADHAAHSVTCLLLILLGIFRDYCLVTTNDIGKCVPHARLPPPTPYNVYTVMRCRCLR